MYINYLYLLWAKLLFNIMESIDLYNDWIKKKYCLHESIAYMKAIIIF